MPYTKAELELISAVVQSNADNAATGAGFGGHMHDGGAYDMTDKFATWTDGYKCGAGERDESEVYHRIVEEARMQADPDYRQYLKLKKRFEQNN